MADDDIMVSWPRENQGTSREGAKPRRKDMEIPFILKNQKTYSKHCPNRRRQRGKR